MSQEAKAFGIVAKFNEEWVETDFNCVAGIPITPAASYYRRSEDQRYPIPLHAQSLLKVYLANHAGLAAIVCFGIGLTQDPSLGLSKALACLGAALGLLCLFGRFRVGKLSAEERSRRLAHQQVTGVNAEPHLMPAKLVENLHEGLLIQWKRNHARWGAPADWQEAVSDQLDPDGLTFLAVLASLEHHLEPDDARRALRRKAWKLQAEAGGCGELESLSPEEAEALLTKREERAQAEAPEQEPAPEVAYDSDSYEGFRATVDSSVVEKKAKPTKLEPQKGIKIRCGRCDHVTRVPKTAAGKTGLCPSCQRPVRVPSRESIRAKRAA